MNVLLGYLDVFKYTMRKLFYTGPVAVALPVKVDVNTLQMFHDLFH